MKALSIKQPWAWLIVNGPKPVENRNWKTDQRGTVLIHAGKSFDMPGYDWLMMNLKRLGIDGLPEPNAYEFGGIVGQVVIVDCVQHHRSPWFQGPNAFVFKDAKPLPFHACRGSLKFFDVNYPNPKGGAMAQPKKDKAVKPAKPKIFCFSDGSKRDEEAARDAVFTGQALAEDGTVLAEGSGADLEDLKKAVGYLGDEKIPLFRAHYPREQYPQGIDLVWAPPQTCASNKALQAAIEKRDASKVDPPAEGEPKAPQAETKPPEPETEPGKDETEGAEAETPETIMLTVTEGLSMEEKAAIADGLAEQLEDYEDKAAEAKKVAKRYRDELDEQHTEICALSRKVNRGGRVEVECRLEERDGQTVPVRIDTDAVVEASEDEVRMAIQDARTVGQGDESGLTGPEAPESGPNEAEGEADSAEAEDQAAQGTVEGEAAPLEVAVKEGEETI